jgi:hypothetical protein
MHGGRMQALAQQPHRRADEHDLSRQQAQRFRPRLGGGKQAGQAITASRPISTGPNPSRIYSSELVRLAANCSNACRAKRRRK